jgi:hypothetical protein
LRRASIGWCVNGMPASTPVGTIFNDLYFFTQNNSRTGFIWTRLIHIANLSVVILLALIPPLPIPVTPVDNHPLWGLRFLLLSDLPRQMDADDAWMVTIGWLVIWWKQVWGMQDWEKAGIGLKVFG